MNIWDRYVRALHATDLRGSLVDETHLDLVHVSGWSQRRQGGLAAMLYRASANPEAGENLEKAREALRTFALRSLERQGKEPDPKVASKAADRIFYDLVKPKCKTCKGVRFVAIPGTGRLSDIACPACHGSGETATARDDEFTGNLRTVVGMKLQSFARSMNLKLRA